MIYLYAEENAKGAQDVITCISNFLKNKKISFCKIYNFKDIKNKIIEKADIFLCGIPINNYSKNYTTIKYLKNKTKNIYFILDHWHNSYKNFFDKNNNKYYLPKTIFCIDDYMKEKFMKKGFSKDLIIPVGHPVLEDTFLKKYSFEKVKILKNSLNLKNKKIVTLFLDPIGNRRSLIGYDENDVIDLVLTCNVNNNFHFLIKPHPRNDLEKIKNIISLKSKNKKNITLFDDKISNLNAFDLVNISDIVLGMTSIMLAHSLAINKKTASLQINPTQKGKMRSNIYFNKILINNKDSLLLFLESNDYFKKEILENNIFSNVCEKIFRRINN